MASTTYRTGSWLGIVRNGSVIVLERQTDQAIVGHLWDFLGRQPTIHGVLNEVTEKFGTGLTGLPHFAIVVQSDRLHAILRGDITLLAYTGDAEDVVCGRDVTTWSERSLPLPDSFMLTLAEPEAGKPLVLPVGEAVVPLQSLNMEIDAPAESSTHDGGLPASATIEAAAAQTAGNGGFAHEGISLHNGAGEKTAIFQPAKSRLVQDQTGVDQPDGEEPRAAGFVGRDLAGQQPEEETDAEEYAGFAMAAAAADADWNAQPAPVDVSAGAETDLNLTMRPEHGDNGEQPAETNFADVSAGDLEQAERAPEERTPKDLERENLERDEQAQAAQPAHPEPHASEAALETAEEGFTTNYDYLFGATIAKSVEGAAVRLDEDGQPVQPGPDPVMPPLPPVPPVAGNSAAHPRDPADVGAAAQDLAQHPEKSVGEDTGAAPEQGGEPVGLLIDSVPWGKAGASGAPAPAPGDESATPAKASVALAPARGDESATPAKASAAPAPAPGDESATPAKASAAPAHELPEQSFDPDPFDRNHFDRSHFDPDHDGQTVMRGDVTGPQLQAAVEQLESRPPTGPMVLARMCPTGHANPPSRSLCSDCGVFINSEPREVGRPRLGSMHISSGEVVELDYSLIIGRQPSVSRVMGGAMPRLVQVKSGNDDISRSHVEVRLDGWDVLLVDLKATNGTVLVREGQAPRRLSQGEEAILLNGDIAELGDGVSLLFDGLL